MTALRAHGRIRSEGIERTRHAGFGLHELVNIKHVSVDFGGTAAMPWWYPYDAAFHAFTRSAFGTLYSNDPLTKVPDALGLLGSGRFFGYVKVSALASRLGKVF